MWVTITIITLVLLTQLLTFLTALFAFLKSSQNSNAIQEVHLSLNSRLNELVESTRIASHAAGRAEGLAERKKE
jgi:hypothetical protein